MPNVMATLPNIGGAVRSTPQNSADAHYYRVPCSNAAKTRNPLKFAGVPQTPEPISAVRGPKFTILREHLKEVLLLNKLFSDCLSCEDKEPNKVVRWCRDGDFCVVFASCVSSEPHAAHFRPAS